MAMRSILIVAALAACPAVASAAIPRVVDHFADPRRATCLAPAPDALWIGSEGGGLVRYTPDAQVRFTAARGLPGNRVHGCVWHRGVVWVAAGHGLGRFENDVWHTAVPGRFLAVAAAGSVLLAGRDDGVLFLRGTDGRWVRLQLDMAPVAVAVAADGRWAVGGIDGRVVVGTTASGSLVPTTPSARLPAPITALHFDGDDLSIETADGRGSWRRGDPAPVSALAVDSDEPTDIQVFARARWRGRRYLATDEGARVADGAGGWTELDLGGMPCGDRIAAVTVFDDALWVGSFDRGLCRYDGRAWTRFSGSAYLASDMVNDLAADGDKLLVATLAGLTIIERIEHSAQLAQPADGWRFTVSRSADCADDPRAACPWHPSVTGVTVDEVNGDVWVVDTGSAHRLPRAGARTKRWSRFYRGAGLTSARLTRVAARDGIVAVATGDRGLHIRRHRGNFVTVDDQHGLADNWVMDVAFDDAGALWVASCTRGVSVLRGGEWKTLTTRDGLVDDYALAVVPIDGRIWIGTLNGLTVLEPDGTAASLTVADGLGGGEVHDIAKWRGRVWVATDGGLTVLDPSPPPRLDGVTVAARTEAEPSQ